MYKITLIIVSFLFFLNSIKSQSLTLMEDVSFFENGKEILNPFAGGLKAGQFSDIDLDGDGKKDLVVFDRNSAIVTTYINKGEFGEINYRLDQSYADLFPSSRSFMILHDFNGDGIEDIFKDPTVSGSNSIEVWRGRRDGSGLYFELMRNRDDYFNILFYLANNKPVNVYCASTDIPGIIDVDGDGDTDILSFETDGAFLNYYRNMAVEKNLGLDTFDFKFTLSDPDQFCFGKFKETMFSSTVVLSNDQTSCASGVLPGPNQNGGPRHAGSTTTAFDHGCDGDVDIILGDFLTPDIAFLENTGSAIDSWITKVEARYPANNVSAMMEVFLASYLLDVNNDGLMDMIVTPNQKDIAKNEEHVWLYLNEGDNCFPDWKLHTKSFLIDEMLHFYGGSHPQFCDYNQDGLTDIIIGTGGRLESGLDITNSLVLLKNIGTAVSPAYGIVTTDYLELSKLPETLRRLAVDIADLDGDGDDDLFLAESNGVILYFENIAGQGQPYEFADPVFDWLGIFVGNNPSPEVYDVDGDGLLDITFGENNNEFSFLKNTGTATDPQFNTDVDASGNLRQLGNIYEGNDFFKRNGSPVFFKSEDTNYLIQGVTDGSLRLFNDIKVGVTDTFNLITDSIDDLYVGERVTADIADINNDKKYDLAVGNDRGGIHLFSTDIAVDNSVNTFEQDRISIGVFPNPVRSYLYLELEDQGIVELYNLEGKRLYTGDVIPGINTIPVQQLTPNIYFIKVQTSDGYAIKKFVKN